MGEMNYILKYKICSEKNTEGSSVFYPRLLVFFLKTLPLIFVLFFY